MNVSPEEIEGAVGRLRAWCEEWPGNTLSDDLSLVLEGVGQGSLPAAPSVPVQDGSAVVGQWRDLQSDPPPHPKGGAVYVDVRSVTTYRWLPYKVPQGGRKGRWQEANDYGFNNAPLPARGEWKLNLPVKAPAAPDATPDTPAAGDEGRQAEVSPDRVAVLEKALEWYGEQARLARLIHSEGDAGRNALASDGGELARQALQGGEEQ